MTDQIQPFLIPRSSIDSAAQSLSKKYKIDSSRVMAILLRMAEIDVASSTIDSTPLNEALRVLRPDQTLDLFENSDLNDLFTRYYLYAYFQRPTTPCYTIAELGDITRRAIYFLDENEQNLISLGFPERQFQKSRWLNRKLMKQYFVKMPVATQRRRSPIAQYMYELGKLDRGESNEMTYEYSWATASDWDDIVRLRIWLDKSYVWLPGIGWDDDSLTARDRRPARFCEYHEAPHLPIFNHNEVEKLQDKDLRQNFFECKKNVLVRLVKACHNRELPIRYDCFGIMKETGISADDIEFLLSTDLKYRVFQSHITDSATIKQPQNEIQTFGGILDLLELIGHYETEIKYGVYDQMRRALKRAGKVPYFATLNHEAHAELNQSLDIVLEKADDIESDWLDFQEMFLNEMSSIYREKARINIYIDVPGHQIDSLNPDEIHAALEQSIYNQIHLKTRDIEPLDVNENVTAQPDYLFAEVKRGEVWSFRFNGKDLGSIGHRKCFHFIKHLLENPQKLAPDTSYDAICTGENRVGTAYYNDFSQEQFKEENLSVMNTERTLSELDGTMDIQKIIDMIKDGISDSEDDLNLAVQNNDIGRASDLRESIENRQVELAKQQNKLGQLKRKASSVKSNKIKQNMYAFYSALTGVKKKKEQFKHPKYGDFVRHLRNSFGQSEGNWSYDPKDDKKNWMF